MQTSTWRLAPGWAAANICLSGVATAATLAVPRLVGASVDQLHRESTATGALTRLALILTTVVIATTAEVLCAGQYTIRVTSRLRQRAIESVTDRDAPGLPGPGDVATRLLVDAQHPAAALNITISLTASAVTLVAALLSIAVIDWWVFAGLMLGLVALLGVLRRFMADTTATLQEYRAGQAAVADLALDAQRGAATIQAHGTWRTECTRVLRPMARMHAAGRELWSLQATLAWRAGIFVPATLLITLSIGALSFHGGRIGIGELTVLVGYTALVIGSLDGVETAAQLPVTRVGARRLAEITHQSAGPPVAFSAAPRGAVALTFTGVRLDRSSIDELSINFEVAAGECVVVTGSTANAATLAYVAAGVQTPIAGEVHVDRIPQRSLAPDAGVVALASARPPFLGSSIAHFLALGVDHPDRELVRHAARQARIHHVIEALPYGYDTPIQELALSGGELQRLGIAQALLHASGALVLHEATSSLDPATELEVVRALRATKGSRTLLIASQQPALGALADRTIDVNEQGGSPCHDLTTARPRL